MGSPLITYVYAAWVEAFHQRIFSEVHIVQDVDHTVIGRLTNEEYTALVKCALTRGDLKGRLWNILKKAAP